MRTYQAACLLPVLGCLLATASAKGQPARHVQRRTIVQHATITAAPTAPYNVKRQDAPVPTVTVDDPANIQTATDGLTAPLPTGNAISLIKNDDGSVDFLLGPDINAQVQQAAAGSCEGDQGPGCQEAVQSVIHQANFGVQSRAIGLLTAAAGIALAHIASVLIYYYIHDQPAPVRVHMPPPTVAQITSLSDASSVVLSTAGETATTVAVPVETDAGTTTAPSNPSGTAVAANLNEAGDLVINIQEDSVLQWLQQEAHNNDQCAATPARAKRQAMTCGIFHGQNALNALNGPLVDLLVMPNMPRPRNAAILNAAVALFQAGKTITGLASLTEDKLWDIAYFLALYYNEPGAADAGATVTIPASEIDPQAPDSEDDNNGACPTGAGTPACEDEDCQGDPDGDATCVAAPKTSCSCAAIATPILNTDGDIAWLDAQQTGLAQMFLNAQNGDSGDKQCSVLVFLYPGAPPAEGAKDVGITVTLRDGDGNDVDGSTFSGGMNFGEIQSVNDPDGQAVSFEMGDAVVNDDVEVHFHHGSKDWELSSCEKTDTTDVVDGIERTCKFDCKA